MQQSGEYRIGASRDEVWRSLNDADILARCIDGCKAMTRVSADAFEATVKAKVGPVSATFHADIRLADLDPPNSYSLNLAVKGGAAGFGKGVARVRLSDDDLGTLLRYEVEGSVGGKLAQVGQRLIDGVVRKMAEDFFVRFVEAVAPSASGTVEAAAVERATPGAPEASDPGGRETSGLWIVWGVVFAVLLVALILAL